MSLASLQPSSGTTTVPIQCEKYQTNTTNSHRTMPSHYRNSRPIVIQPMRPTPSPTLRQQQQPYQSRSHSPHLYTNSTLSSSNQYHNSALKNAISVSFFPLLENFTVQYLFFTVSMLSIMPCLYMCYLS